MANLLEVLFTCDSNNTLWTCALWDPHTGANLMSYKGGGTAVPKTMSFIAKDYLVTAEKDKPLLHIWPLNSQQTVQGMRFVLPGKANAVAISQDGSYCVAGIDEKIYLWQITSGNLLTIISRHYQKIVMIKFTSDGKYIISAAEDGMVIVWSLTTIAAHPDLEFATQSMAGHHDPIHVFSDHSLPVTDMYVSKMGMQGRLCTVSTDRTCKIYDLSSGEMLLNLVFDVPLLSVTMDVLELSVFIGTNEGNVYQFSLKNPPRARDFLVNNNESCPTFSHHTKGVTCLSVSLDGETLMSGGNDENVVLWHIRSRQAVKIIKHKGAITNAFFALNLPSIYNQNFSPNIILHNLQRNFEKDSDEVNEIEVINKATHFWPKLDIKENSNDVTPQIMEVQLEFKNNETKLREEIQNLKKINADLYAYSVHGALQPPYPVPVRENGIKRKRKNK